MGNLASQQQLEQMEQDLKKMRDSFSERLAALESRMSKKQEGTNKTLTQLLEGQF